MIISDYHLEKARYAFQFNDRLAEFRRDAPAELRVLVRLPHAIHFHDVKLIAAMHYRENGLNPPMQICELERYSAEPHEAVHFFRFEHIFEHDKDYDIRVEFYVDANIAGKLKKEPIGRAQVKLKEIIGSQGETIEVPLMSLSDNKMISMKAEFGLEYLRILSAKFLLDVHIRIHKSRDWPLNSARPFFMMFRWDRHTSSWLVIYTSEVLDRPTDYPDANGAMMFAEFETNIKQVVGDDHDDQPLRFEFFHLNHDRNKKLLGYFTTTLRNLRGQSPDSELELHTNTFADGELYGSAHISGSFVSMVRHYFNVQVEFGGVSDGPFVYLDVSISDSSSDGLYANLKRQRPCYKIMRYGDDGNWSELYRSEVPLHGFSSKRAHKFNVAKLSEDKLSKSNTRSPIYIVFCAKTLWGNEVTAGTVKTNLEELAKAKSGQCFPLQTEDDQKGYFELLQVEAGKAFKYFSVRCVVGASQSEETDAPSLLTAPTAKADLV